MSYTAVSPGYLLDVEVEVLDVLCSPLNSARPLTAPERRAERGGRAAQSEQRTRTQSGGERETSSKTGRSSPAPPADFRAA